MSGKPYRRGRHNRGRASWWQTQQHQQQRQHDSPQQQQQQQSAWRSPDPHTSHRSTQASGWWPWKPNHTSSHEMVQHGGGMPDGGEFPTLHYYALKEAEDRRKKKKEQRQLGRTLRKSLTSVKKKGKKKRKSKRGKSSSSSSSSGSSSSSEEGAEQQPSWTKKLLKKLNLMNDTKKKDAGKDMTPKKPDPPTTTAPDAAMASTMNTFLGDMRTMVGQLTSAKAGGSSNASPPSTPKKNATKISAELLKTYAVVLGYKKTLITSPMSPEQAATAVAKSVKAPPLRAQMNRRKIPFAGSTKKKVEKPVPRAATSAGGGTQCEMNTSRLGDTARPVSSVASRDAALAAVESTSILPSSL